MSNYSEFEIADLKVEPGKNNTKTQQFIFVLAESNGEADAIARHNGFGECKEVISGNPPHFSRTWMEWASAPFSRASAAKPVVPVPTATPAAAGPSAPTNEAAAPVGPATTQQTAPSALPTVTSPDNEPPTETTDVVEPEPVPTAERPPLLAITWQPASDTAAKTNDEDDRIAPAGPAPETRKKKRAITTPNSANIQVLTGLRWDANEPTEATAAEDSEDSAVNVVYTVIEATRADPYAIMSDTMEMTEMLRLLRYRLKTMDTNPSDQPYVELKRNSYDTEVPVTTIDCDGSSILADMVYTKPTGNAVIFSSTKYDDCKKKMKCTTVYASSKPKTTRVVGYTDDLVRYTTSRFKSSGTHSDKTEKRSRLLLFCTLVYTGWGKYQRAATVEHRGTDGSSLTCNVGEDDDADPDDSQFPIGTVFHFTLSEGKSTKKRTFQYTIPASTDPAQVHVAAPVLAPVPAKVAPEPVPENVAAVAAKPVPALATVAATQQIEIPWIKTKGNWELLTRWGAYLFVPNKMTIETSMIDQKETGTVEKKFATVVVTHCFAKEVDVECLKSPDSVTSLSGTNITHIKGAIAKNMQTPVKGGKYRIFVLPSQLNAAEYRSEERKHVVTKLSEYIKDGTGGPSGQLAGDPGIAQFIIDNACNETRPTNGSQGIDNTRLMGTINGISLKNGYLHVDENADVAKFENRLHLMTVMGVMDVPVRGLVHDHKSFVNTTNQTNSVVGLIYASAVPIDAYGNGGSEKVKRVADLTLFAQYTGSMRLAVNKQKCELYLTPVGGGYFNNKRENVRAAMVSAAAFMKTELEEANVDVFVLTYEGKPKEVDFFNR